MSSRVLVNRYTPTFGIFVDCENRTNVTYQSIVDKILKSDLSGPFIVIDSCLGIEDEKATEDSERGSSKSTTDSCS